MRHSEQLELALEIPSVTGQKMSARVGYTRVSTVSQTLEQQNAALPTAGVSKTFSDVMADRDTSGDLSA